MLVSYVNWLGLSAVADPLEAFLERGGIVRSLFGVDNGVTTPDALAYAYYLTQRFPHGYRLAAVVPWQYSDSIFHPKYFQLNRHQESVLLVGSGNLTGGGVLRNHEVGFEITVSVSEAAYNDCTQMWLKYLVGSRRITPTLIRRLDRANRLANEKLRAEAPVSGPRLPRFGLALPARRKPALFKHILRSGLSPQRRHSALAQSDTLSNRPQRLYLEILQETGGGHQVQLPVATLGTFFGVASGQTKPVRFRFDDELVDVQLTHFPNNTHRVRLRPLQGVRRPAIVIFRRRAVADDYDCTIETGYRYRQQLRYCTEQTRIGSRRWGLT